VSDAPASADVDADALLGRRLAFVEMTVTVMPVPQQRAFVPLPVERRLCRAMPLSSSRTTTTVALIPRSSFRRQRLWRHLS